MNKINTDEIIQGILKSDANIINYVYKENFLVFRKYVNENSGNDDDSADVFQDTIMAIYQKAKEGNLNIYVSFGTYLFSVAKRLWLEELRKRKLKNIVPSLHNIDVIDENYDFEFEILYNERHKLIWNHFDKLSNDCKKIIKLFIDEKSVAEVTKIMQFNSDQHTKNRRMRCKSRLITFILKDPQFKKLKNEKVKGTDQIARW
jgi:RNA polymerase sigma factor (sigma-70 family)